MSWSKKVKGYKTKRVRAFWPRRQEFSEMPSSSGRHGMVDYQHHYASICTLLKWNHAISYHATMWNIAELYFITWRDAFDIVITMEHDTLSKVFIFVEEMGEQRFKRACSVSNIKY